MSNELKRTSSASGPASAHARHRRSKEVRALKRSRTPCEAAYRSNAWYRASSESVARTTSSPDAPAATAALRPSPSSSMSHGAVDSETSATRRCSRFFRCPSARWWAGTVARVGMEVTHARAVTVTRLARAVPSAMPASADAAGDNWACTASSRTSGREMVDRAVAAASESASDAVDQARGIHSTRRSLRTSSWSGCTVPSLPSAKRAARGSASGARALTALSS
mmetsp:Transcript_6652/g.21532  ORF Transcript_6652/g.21532 Transcript_6652/m.21532 type:complete len:224 (+) Transcript_6652:3684-4355(+)